MKHLLLLLFSTAYARQALFRAMALTLNRYFDYYPDGSEGALLSAVRRGTALGPYVLTPRERLRLRLLSWRAGGWFLWESAEPSFYTWREWGLVSALVRQPTSPGGGYR